GPDLETLRFGDREGSRPGHIEVPSSRVRDLVAARVSNGAQRRDSKRSLVDPLPQRPAVASGGLRVGEHLIGRLYALPWKNPNWPSKARSLPATMFRGTPEDHR